MISVKDREIYTYGLVQGLVMIINVVTTVLIGFALGMVMECCVFLALYIPIRRYAGGYHAKTQTSCYIFSIIMILVSMWMIENIAWTLQINLIISLILSILLILAYFLSGIRSIVSVVLLVLSAMLVLGKIKNRNKVGWI